MDKRLMMPGRVEAKVKGNHSQQDITAPAELMISTEEFFKDSQSY